MQATCIEAAVAYYSTTGKRKLLDVAIRVADNIDNTFRLKDSHWVSGHEEIELGFGESCIPYQPARIKVP
jgi:DUF1680 family protein